MVVEVEVVVSQYNTNLPSLTPSGTSASGTRLPAISSSDPGLVDKNHYDIVYITKKGVMIIDYLILATNNKDAVLQAL